MPTANEVDGYSVFISFCGADQEAWRSAFKQRLEQNLRKPGRRIFFSETDPILAGDLKEQIRRALGASRFMVSIIGPGYLKSEWCQFELEEFFGPAVRECRRERFLAVCLNQAVSEQVVEWPAWTSAGLSKTTVRYQFYSRDGRAVPAFLTGQNNQAVRNEAFDEQVDRLCEYIESQLAVATTTPAATSAGPKAAVIGAVTPLLEPFAAELEASLANELGSRGWTVGRISLDDIARDDPDDSAIEARLKASTLLVLPISDEAPELPALGPGGHIGYLKERWERSKAQGAADRYIACWRTAISVPEERRAKGRHRDFLAGLSMIDGSAAEVGVSMCHVFYPAEIPPGARSQQAKIVIESNARDPSTGPLKLRIEKLWAMLQREDPALQGISLLAHPLPYSLIRSLNRNLGADAVILVWSAKTEETVYDQVDSVDRDFAPPRKFIAYLTPPNPADAKEDFLGWEVMPFHVKEEEDPLLKTRVKVVEEFEGAHARVKSFLVDLANAKLVAGATLAAGTKLQ